MANTSNKIVNNIAWQFGERILAQLVSLAVSVILARILLPEDYGAVTMVTVFITIANVFVSSGIPTALIQKKDADDLDFSSVFYFNFVLSLFLYLIIFFSAPLISSFYGMDILTPVLRVMGLRIIVASFNSVQHAYVSRKMMFRKYFWATLFGTLFSGIIGILLAFNGFGVWALVAQYMINTTIDTIVLFIAVSWRPRLIFSFSRVGFLFRFGWKILFEGLANEVDGQIRNLIIGKVYSSSDLAFYSKGQQFPHLIVRNISSSISAVLFPAMADEQDNPERVKTILRKSVRIISYLVFPMLIGLALVSENFIKVLLTDKWIDATPFMVIFCFANLLTMGMIPRHQALKGMGYSGVYMVEHIIARIVGLVLLILTFQISPLAIAISGCLSGVILGLIIMFTSKKFNQYAYKEQIIDIMVPSLLCLAMGIPVFLLNYIGLNAFVTLVLQVATGIVIYIGLSILFKVKELKMIVNLLKRRINKKRNGV